MEIVETHASEAKIRAVSVAPRLEHWSVSTGDMTKTRNGLENGLANGLADTSF